MGHGRVHRSLRRHDDLKLGLIDRRINLIKRCRLKSVD